MEILLQFENNISVGVLAKAYNFGKQTVRDIVKKKAELHSFVAKADSAKAISDRKSLKESTLRDLDDGLGGSCRKDRKRFHYQDPSVISQKFHEQFKIKGNLSASSGWLYTIKNRHGIRAMVEFCYDLTNLIK
ncbi:unnamed protein product [Psylliodes chrysocephalus]|uniref:HTH psq-type domain-containing protein n=1 Tax=Psylliodes chrysocephalus TaxID=3402493 RepID=A0A9P0CJN3_9CUCU|nr:unnamed protein product [Psylliodes chrysocephala]